MTEQEVRQLVGHKTILKFDYLVDSVAEYKTVTPVLIDDQYKNYKVSFFCESFDAIFAYDSLDGFLSTMQIFEVTVITDSPSDYNNIYINTYQEKLIIK